ncbi:ankyrin repeat protein, partial [Oesophagostomum dentatum]
NFQARHNGWMGWTPLMIAASAGRVEVVRYLLSLPEVDVNHRNTNRQTALHYAASKNHAEVGVNIGHIKAAEKRRGPEILGRRSYGRGLAPRHIILLVRP